MAEIVTGKNPVVAAVRGGQQVNVIYIAEDIEARALQGLVADAKEQGAKIKRIPRVKLDAMAPGVKHQGFIAEVIPYNYFELEEVIAFAEASGQPPLLLLLDGVQDTMNFGAIIRSAEAFGCHGIIIGRDRSAPVNDVVMRSSAGAVSFMKIARVTNLSHTVKMLKEKNIWVTGAEMSGGENYAAIDYTGATALIIGGEDHGLGRLLASHCDHLAKIPLSGQTPSLNASVAAGVFLAEVSRQRLCR